VTDAADLQARISEELDRLAIPARPIVMPTSWSVGPVVAYLFPDEPITLIDSGLASGRSSVEAALDAAGAHVQDVARVIVTHSHGDHIGGAHWLQEASGCSVYLHGSEIELIAGPRRRELLRSLFLPLGFDEEMLAGFLDRPNRGLPNLTPIDDDTVFDVGDRRLRVEHHPGHTPGHLWIVEEASAAVFVGDYVLETGPTNPGMVLDPDSPSGRAPILAQYISGMRELVARGAPALFAGHGVPIIDAASLVARRIAKIERRTRRVLHVLERSGDATPAVLADRLYRGLARQSFDVMAEVTAHLDLLVSDGRATAELREDGYWHFQARSSTGGSDA
jgi:glyoxylase-like metal-dependent hydrolase (beta-lactamase superfamily II)